MRERQTSQPASLRYIKRIVLYRFGVWIPVGQSQLFQSEQDSRKISPGQQMVIGGNVHVE